MTVTVVAPKRTDEQRLSALRHANEIRTARANLKNDLRSGRVAACDVLNAPAPMFETMKLHAFLRALPGYGERRVYLCLRSCQVAHGKTLSGLTARQRVAVIQFVVRTDRHLTG